MPLSGRMSTTLEGEDDAMVAGNNVVIPRIVTRSVNTTGSSAGRSEVAA